MLDASRRKHGQDPDVEADLQVRRFRFRSGGHPHASRVPYPRAERAARAAVRPKAARVAAILRSRNSTNELRFVRRLNLACPPQRARALRSSLSAALLRAARRTRVTTLHGLDEFRRRHDGGALREESCKQDAV